ncbi:MAG: glycosyltransferase [Lentisphaerae bacterium]|nr:glycosyltransferase [Lentisphaerota bacterium]
MKRFWRSVCLHSRWRRERIDILLWMQECPFADAFIDQVSEARPNSLVVMTSLYRGHFYAYQPPGIVFRRRPLLNIVNALSPAWMGRRAEYLFYPVLLLLAWPIMLLFYLWLGLRFRVGSVFIIDHQQTVVVGLLRRLGLFRRVVYFAGDWYPGSTFRKGIWTRLGNEVYVPILDWMACKLSDLTINQTEYVREGRTRYWGRQIPREEVAFVPPLILKCKDPAARMRGRKILFVGATRADSGLELVLNALPIVRQRLGDVSLKIVGPASSTIEELKQAAAESGLSAFFEYVGVGDYAAFETIFADCYCGVNLITDPDSYSSRAIPAKIPDYLQSLLPALVTPYVGSIVDMIRENDLGLVVKPEVEVVASALIELYEKRAEFIENIRTFILNRTSTNIAELLCPEVPGS